MANIRKYRGPHQDTRVHVQLTEFGNAIDAACNLVAELFAEFVQRDWRVFDDVVQESSGQARHVHLLIDQQIGHRKRVHEVRLAGLAHLAGVQAGGELEGLVERGEILVWAERLDLAAKLFERFLRLGRN